RYFPQITSRISLYEYSYRWPTCVDRGMEEGSRALCPRHNLREGLSWCRVEFVAGQQAQPWAWWGCCCDLSRARRGPQMPPRSAARPPACGRGHCELPVWALATVRSLTLAA